ncbi:hypothetical protein LOD99_3733 [Oopsacas minuta]|uniref:MTHFR SAM-binding regulatory domain-containing protein n=1 Tax=Oopsacas minuta TaxID=111878 RepID=A0AAV7JW61_9METZ|nr:hypothetical protein LOD99_3733 [Oopsacas minuta]
MCTELLRSGKVPGLHFYTLNREIATKDILERIGLWCTDPCMRRLFPWRQSANQRRITEDVRPIFWSSRPKSYIHRTNLWEEFPNGRWGKSSNPEFGALKDHHLFYLKPKFSREELKRMWGEELNCIDDVNHMFYCFISGERNKQGAKVEQIPWMEDSLSEETNTLITSLVTVNMKGILTINSQPAVNGAPSTHPVYGWGIANGYVYQKAYLEFFASPELVQVLIEVLPEYPQVTYHATNKQGDPNITNSKSTTAAVTWGVFSGMEIVQPTVVDPVAFMIWKDEAFDLWDKMWASLYPVGSTSRDIIATLQNTYYLVNLVDNDYVKGNCLFGLLDRVLEKIRGQDDSVFESVGVRNLNIIEPEPEPDEVVYEGEPLEAMSAKRE